MGQFPGAAKGAKISIGRKTDDFSMVPVLRLVGPDPIQRVKARAEKRWRRTSPLKSPLQKIVKATSHFLPRLYTAFEIGQRLGQGHLIFPLNPELFPEIQREKVLWIKTWSGSDEFFDFVRWDIELNGRLEFARPGKHPGPTGEEFKMALQLFCPL